MITKVISDACARGLASSQGGALNIQTDDEAPAVKVKKASITSGKALNLVEEAELSEPEEDLSIETEEELRNLSKIWLKLKKVLSKAQANLMSMLKRLRKKNEHYRKPS